jgi:hypothetical protein
VKESLKGGREEADSEGVREMVAVDVLAQVAKLYKLADNKRL